MASYRIDDPYFSEFVFHCITTASRQSKLRVPFDLDKFVKTQSAAKGFAEKASLEQRLVMLSRLGINWKIWLAPQDGMDKKIMVETLEKYKEDNRLESVNKMIGEKHFVFGDRDLMIILGMMSQNCHSETYRVNREYSKMAREIIDGEERMANVDLMKSSFEDYRILLRFCFAALMNQDFFDGECSFSQKDIMILQFLMLNRNGFVEMGTMVKKFNQYKKVTITNTVYKLFKTKYVEKFPGKNSYCISNTGIQVINNYINRVVDISVNSTV